MTLLNDTGLSLRGRFKFARLAAGLEQEQLAQRIGVSRSTISNWERGLAEPNASHFIQLAEAVGQPLDYFAEGLKYTPRDSNPEPTDYGFAAGCECRARHGRGDCDLGCGCSWCAPELYDELDVAFWAIVEPALS